MGTSMVVGMFHKMTRLWRKYRYWLQLDVDRLPILTLHRRLTWPTPKQNFNGLWIAGGSTSTPKWVKLKIQFTITDQVRAFVGGHVRYYGSAANEDSPLFRQKVNSSVYVAFTWSIFQSDTHVSSSE